MKKLLLFFAAILAAGSMWGQTTLLTYEAAEAAVTNTGTYDAGDGSIVIGRKAEAASGIGYQFKLDGSAAEANTKYLQPILATGITFQAGDIITLYGYTGSTPSESKQLGFALADNRANTTIYTTLLCTRKTTLSDSSTKESLEALSYTIPEESGLIGKSSFVINRMNGNSVYLFGVTITRPAPANQTLYLNTGGSTLWEQANAKFAVYYYNSDSDYGWSAIMTHPENEPNANIYYATIPASYTSCIFVRLNSSATTGNWDDKWNQTGNLTIPSDGNMFTIETLDGDNCTGSWNTYTPSYIVSFDANGHGTAPTAQTIVSGNHATEPTALSENGWIFGGWYTEADCTNAYDFATATVTDNITLFAKWTEDLSTTWKLNIWVGPNDEDWGQYSFEKKAGESNNICYYTLSFPTVGEHDFEVMNGSTYYKNSGKMTPDNCTNWTYTTSNSRGKIEITELGNYIFKIDYSDANNPVVSVTYPVSLQSVSANTVWDFSKAASNEAALPSANGWIVLANVDGVNNDDNFNAQALAAKPSGYAYRSNDYKCFQGKEIKFRTTVPGFVVINGCNPTKNSTITISYRNADSGDYTELKQITAPSDKASTVADMPSFAVNAGDVEIKATDGNVRIYKLTFVTSVSLPVSAAGYATYYNENMAFTMPEGLEGITVSANGSTLTLNHTYAAGSVVPAGEPLLIKGAEGSYNLVAATTTNAKVADNALHGNQNAGTVATVENANKYYKLLNGSHGIGWYLGAENGGVFTLGANKAYLALNVSGDAPAHFSLTDEVTAVEDAYAVEAAEVVKFMENGQLFIKKNGVVYNAMGQIVK